MLTALLSCSATAAEPRPFELHYAASYGNFAATAERTLQPDATGGWQLRSRVALDLFGNTVSSIMESSQFSWQDGQLLSRSYLFEQKGIGRRSRSLDFANDGNSAVFRINDNSGTLTLAGQTYDALNSGLVLRDRVAAGDTDISFNVAERGEVNTHHYRVTGMETLTLPAGSFTTVHVGRLRDDGSDRTTDLWLATEHDFVLVKLLQAEPDGDTITLELESGSVGGAAITPPVPAGRTAAALP